MFLLNCRDHGRWSDEGIHTTNITNEHIICSSDHLTSFTVLATRVSCICMHTVYVNT